MAAGCGACCNKDTLARDFCVGGSVGGPLAERAGAEAGASAVTRNADGTIAVASPHGCAGTTELRLRCGLSKRLVDFAGRCEVSLAALLQGAFAVLLSQEVAQDDLLYATARSGRRSAPMDTDHMIGMLMVASPVRLQMPSDLSFRDLLLRVRELSVAVCPFEHTSIAVIRRLSTLPSRGPFTEVLFNFQPRTVITALSLQDPGWQTRDIELFERNGQALTLNIFGGEDIVLNAEWDGVRCSGGAGRRFVRRLAELLEEIAGVDPATAFNAVGYGEVVPLTTFAARLFAGLMGISGLGVLTFLFTSLTV